MPRINTSKPSMLKVTNIDCGLVAELQRLKQENEELKEVNQSLSILGTDLASANETVRKEFFRADKNKDMWREKAENYRKALEEIREIFKKQLPTEVIQGRFPMIYYSEYFNREKQILDKINEVLG